MLDQINARRILQRNIHNRHIRLGLGDGLQSLRRRFAFATNREIRLLVDQVRQPFPNQRMIVHQKNAFLVLIGRSSHFAVLSLVSGTADVKEHFTNVPPVGFGSIEMEPPIMAARCAMIRVPRPLPFSQFSARPMPSSSTVKRTSPSRSARLMPI